MYPLAKYLFYTTGIFLLTAFGGMFLLDNWRLTVVISTVAFAISLRFSKRFRGYQFTAWIIAVVTAAMIYPAQFLHVGNFDMRNKWVMLIAIQLVMFGMGTQ